MIKSDSIANLAVALAAVQSKVESVKRDAVNPHFRNTFATLGAMWSAVRELLAEQGLSVVQLGSSDDQGHFIVETILMHASGEYIGSSMAMPMSKIDPQGLGSAFSYGRRYQFQAIIGLVSDDDDDGESHRTQAETSRQVQSRQSQGQNANAGTANSSRTASQDEKRSAPAFSGPDASQGTQSQNSGPQPSEETEDEKRDKYVKKIQVLRDEIEGMKGDPGAMPNTHLLTLDELAAYGLELRDQRDRLQRTREGEKATGRGAAPPARTTRR